MPLTISGIRMPCGIESTSFESGTMAAAWASQVGYQNDLISRRAREAEGAAQHGAEQRQRERMGDDRARIADRIDAADGARLAHLVAHQLGRGLLEAHMADRERRDRHLVAGR